MNKNERPYTVLVVDDDLGPRDAVRGAFEEHREIDFQVDLAETKEEALDILRERAHDVYVIDLSLRPGLPDVEPGTELVRLLQVIEKNASLTKLPKPVKVVYSAYLPPEQEVRTCARLMQAGAWDVIEKSRHADSVGDVVRSVVRRIRQIERRREVVFQAQEEWLPSELKVWKRDHAGDYLCIVDGVVRASASTNVDMLQSAIEKGVDLDGAFFLKLS